jgi:hypothetical protein
MLSAKQYRVRAAEYSELAKVANKSHDSREFQDLERTFTELADNEQWVTDHYDHTLHAAKHGADGECEMIEADPGYAINFLRWT